MTTNEANEFLMGAGVPAAKFETIGAMVTGFITAADVRDQTDFQTGDVLFWKDGSPRKQLVITLETEDRDPDVEFDDGARRIYAKGNMLNAIRAVAKPHGGIEVGGKLRVKYVRDGEQKQRGFNPPKEYQAWYAPPAKRVEVPDEPPPYNETPDDLDPDDSPF